MATKSDIFIFPIFPHFFVSIVAEGYLDKLQRAGWRNIGNKNIFIVRAVGHDRFSFFFFYFWIKKKTFRLLEGVPKVRSSTL